MADPDLSSRLLFVHRSLLSGEVTAPRALFELCLKPLVAGLRTKYPGSSALWEDAAVDAILEMIQHPHNYDPGKSAVLTYLSVIAYRRLIDSERREQRQTRLFSLETDRNSAGSVEDGEKSANTSLEAIPKREQGSQEQLSEAQMFLENNEERAQLKEVLHEIFPDARDRQAFELIAYGRTSTEELASIFNLQELSIVEKRKEVKRHRDRILKRVQRWRS